MTLNKSNKKPSRNIPEKIKIKLALVSGGRCEFRGCNDFLFQHPITLQDGNFSEHAHIYPFSEKGTRGGQGPIPKNIHCADNLMLLCPTCHHLVDDKKNKYTIDILKEMKAEHEERIYYVSSFSPDQKSHVLILKGFILDQASDITFHQTCEAMAPMYPVDRKGMILDLTQFGTDVDPDYFQQSEKYIIAQLEKFYERDINGAAPNHISVFALASIPLLVCLGRHLNNKIPIEFFHRHRGGEKPWRWMSATTPLRLEYNQIQTGTDPTQVGIIISMSGRIQREDLPTNVNTHASLYEISVLDQDPSVRILHTRDDLDHFRLTYGALLANICKVHPSCTDLHLFLAAPPPVAIICGHDRLPKVQPVLRLYDNIPDNETKKKSFCLRLSVR